MTDIRNLKYFIELSKTLNFNEAAKNCNVSQPTLSIQIKQLEEDIGLDLFHRTNRSVKLSSYGQVLLKKAKQAVLSYKSFENQASKLRKKTNIKCGIDLCIAPKIKEEIIKYLLSKNIAITETPAKALENKLNLYTLDLIISSEVSSQKSSDHIKIAKEPFYIVFPKTHYLSQLKNSKLKLIIKEKILILDEFKESQLYTWLKNNKKSADLNSINTLDTLTQVIEKSGWISILPKSYLKNLPTTLSYLQIKDCPWSHSISVSFQKQNIQIEEFREIATMIQNLYSSQPFSGQDI
jgi:DNA-binding transcriptional LysR family regulator